MNTNNVELKSLMTTYDFNHTRLAEFLGMTSNSTRAWTCNPTSTRFRAMPNSKLKMLKMAITMCKLKPVSNATIT